MAAWAPLLPPSTAVSGRGGLCCHPCCCPCPLPAAPALAPTAASPRLLPPCAGTPSEELCACGAACGRAEPWAGPRGSWPPSSPGCSETASCCSAAAVWRTSAMAAAGLGWASCGRPGCVSCCSCCCACCSCCCPACSGVGTAAGGSGSVLPACNSSLLATPASCCQLPSSLLPAAPAVPSTALGRWAPDSSCCSSCGWLLSCGCNPAPPMCAVPPGVPSGAPAMWLAAPLPPSPAANMSPAPEPSGCCCCCFIVCKGCLPLLLPTGRGLLGVASCRLGPTRTPAAAGGGSRPPVAGALPVCGWHGPLPLMAAPAGAMPAARGAAAGCPASCCTCCRGKVQPVRNMPSLATAPPACRR